MASAINNTLQLTKPQTGLLPIPTSFGTPKVGGTTTPQIGGATSQNNFAGIPFGSGTQTPVPATDKINFGSLPVNPPAIQPQTNTGLPGLVSPQNAGAGQNFNQYEASQGYPQGGLITPPATTQGANPNPTFPGLVGGIAGMASQPTQPFTQSQNTSQQAAQGLINAIPQQNQNVQTATQNLQDLQNEYAKQEGIIGNSPIGLSEQGGEQGLLNQQYASKLGAAQTALQNALTGNQQVQSAFTGAGNLANTAGGVATGQQATQLGALGQAAGLAQPSLAAPGQSYANPLTGQFGNIAGTQGGGGGLSQIGGLQSQIQQGGQIQTMVGQQSQAQSLASNLSGLIDSSGVTVSAPGALQNFVGGVNQWLNTQSGDPKYQNFANLINEISSRYASILNQAGGTPTDQSTISHSIINGLASGQSIKDVLSSLDKNATDSINALKGASQTNAPGTATPTGGNTFGSFF